MQIEFQLERRIGALSENPSGYTKELNVEPQRQAWQRHYADQRGTEEAAQAHRRGNPPNGRPQ